MSLRDLPGWLDGRWAIERVINGGEGRFTGDAVFGPDRHGGALWCETGRLVIGGFDGPAFRTLHLVPDRGTWQVRFDDGRPFHSLDLTTGRWEASHLCGRDLYEGRFAVDDRDRMTIRWRVTGPERNDIIATRYRRTSSLGGAGEELASQCAEVARSNETDRGPACGRKFAYVSDHSAS